MTTTLDHARQREEAALQVLADAIAALRLVPHQSRVLEAAAGSYAHARAQRIVAERDDDPVGTMLASLDAADAAA